MEITTPTSCRELPELIGMGMEDPNLFNQWYTNSVDELGILPLAAASLIGENTFSNYNCDLPLPEFNLSYRPPKHLKTNSNSNSNSNNNNNNCSSWINSCKTDHDDDDDDDDIAKLQGSAFSPNKTFPFAYPMANVKPNESACNSRMSSRRSTVTDILFSQQNDLFGTQNYVRKGCNGHGHGAKRVSSSSWANRINNSQAQDHIMAERKRREKLSQKFIALSALLPGLKKMDKASVLGDAIKHLKQLQDKVKTLEEEAKNKSSIESVVLVKKSQLLADIDDFSLHHDHDNNNFSGPFYEPLPAIEARFCDKSVLIRIHCEKRKGLSPKIMSEIEKSHLTVINSSVITFGTSALDITVVAQMDMEFRMTVKDLVKKLRAAFKFLI